MNYEPASMLPPLVKTRSGKIHYRLSCKVFTSRQSHSIGAYHQTAQSAVERGRMVGYGVELVASAIGGDDPSFCQFSRNEAYRLTGRVFVGLPIGSGEPYLIGMSQSGQVYRLLEQFPDRQTTVTDDKNVVEFSAEELDKLDDYSYRLKMICKWTDHFNWQEHRRIQIYKIQLRQLQAEQVTRQRKRKPVESTGPFRQVEQPASQVEWFAMPLGLRIALSEITGAAGKPVSEAYRLEIAAYALCELDRVQQVAERMRDRGKDDAKYLAKATYPVIVKRARSAYRSERSGRMATESHSVQSCVVFCPESELAAIHSRRLLATVASEPSKADDRLFILRQHVDGKAIELMARGITQVEICKQLGISERTLRNQLAAARKAFADLPVPALSVE